MKTKDLKPAIAKWIDSLIEDEKAENTINQYSQSMERFVSFMENAGEEEITKRTLISYKNELLNERVKNLNNPKPGRTQVKTITTINSRLIALNKFFKDSGFPELTVKLEKDVSANTLEDTLTEREFERLIEWAGRLGKERAGLLMETLAGTGIRIGELGAITVESLKTRMPVVTNKGKTRTIFIPRQLAKKLKNYCAKNGITSGIIFHGRDPEKPLHISTIRQELKYIGGKARGIRKDKIHPHNFRHLFAQRYANMPGAQPFYLPALLGHSDKTAGVTAIYTKPKAKTLLAEVDKLESYYSGKGKNKK